MTTKHKFQILQFIVLFVGTAVGQYLIDMPTRIGLFAFIKHVLGLGVLLGAGAIFMALVIEEQA